MLLLVVASMAADLLTFSLAVPKVGIAAEMNPVMAQAYINMGLVSVILLKAACTAAICLALLRITRRPLRRLTALFAISVGLLGTLGNLVTWSVS
jgi:hypothetical protein